MSLARTGLKAVAALVLASFAIGATAAPRHHHRHHRHHHPVVHHPIHR